jgi:outer membrane protein TolC
VVSTPRRSVNEAARGAATTSGDGALTLRRGVDNQPADVFRPLSGIACALVFLALGFASTAAGAEGTESRTATGLEPGASTELKASLKEEPDIWTVLRAQYQVPTSPIVGPEITGLRTVPARLTLREAVLTAIRNNPGIIAESLGPLAQETGILEAQAQFDPIFGAETGIDRLAQPTSNLLQGGREPIVKTNDGYWNFRLAKALRTGAFVELQWLNDRARSTSNFFALDPYYTPEALATLNQPLLRGFGLYFTSLRIQLAETATEISIEQYKAAVANFILSVVANYWAVVGLEERLEVLKGSLELAEKTVRDNRTRVDVGVLPPVAVLESEAEAARRKEDVIVATNDLAIAQRRLRQQVFLPGESPFFPQAVEPVDRPSREEIRVDVEDAIRLALERRPEVLASRLAIEGRQLDVALTENQLLPRLDLFGSVGTNALAGTERVIQDPLDPTVPVGPSPWQGDYGDALNRLVDGRFYSYSAGVRIEVPIGNAGAKAQAERARVEQQRSYDTYRQTASEVSLEVGQAAGDVGSDQERIETTKVARELSEENLRNQTKRYEVGMVTTTDLLQFQNDLASARVAEIQSLIEYNVSRTRLDRAQGTLLSRFDVEVAPRSPTTTPWWARF